MPVTDPVTGCCKHCFRPGDGQLQHATDRVTQNITPNAQFRAIPRSATFLQNNEFGNQYQCTFRPESRFLRGCFQYAASRKTADETNALLNVRLDGFLAELKNIGDPTDDIYVDMVDFFAQIRVRYEQNCSKRTYTEVPKGFELQKETSTSVIPHLRCSTGSSPQLPQEIYDIVESRLFRKRSQKVYTELRDVAFRCLSQIKTQYRATGLPFDSAYVITAEIPWVACMPINRTENSMRHSSPALRRRTKNSMS